ncbi:PREDICTED: uncharacterized protein KIAA0195-like isoform X2 [Priapulus caudatus]|uniref:Uncharacterized protein KIAA0195-like isoform X2 n=1 Tax=Priapulus caudatus TaxID=37621 RepID=A0ABM1DNK8_PRICU|nr:PREDICTED: uncharacterized protein KIAA0195-like isoform X2 [Priapulus caudatus]
MFYLDVDKESTEETVDPSGLTTKDALTRLASEIRCELARFEVQQARRGFLEQWQGDLFRHGSVYCSLHWPSIAILLIEVILLLVAFFLTDEKDSYSPRHMGALVEACVISVLLMVNMYMVGLDMKLAYSEMLTRATDMLRKIEGLVGKCKWNASSYPALRMPLSPCITLQWTYRDGVIVNLPQTLLVHGDVIAMRPGYSAPARCRPLEMAEKSNTPSLVAGDLYMPEMEGQDAIFCMPQERQPLGTRKFLVLETPYIKILRIALWESFKRPTSTLNKARHIVYTYYVEKVVLPLVLICMIIANSLRFVYLRKHVGEWPEMFILLQADAIIPLLPLVFPVMWLLLTDYGIATVLAALEYHNMLPAKAQTIPYDSLPDEETTDVVTSNVAWREVLPIFVDVLRGRCTSTLPRTASILHALGSATAFCCIDKKGILSWPNPTTEKVFLLADKGEEEGGGGGGGGGDNGGGDDVSCDSGSVMASALNVTDTAAKTREDSFEGKDTLAPLQSARPDDLQLPRKTTVVVLDFSHDNLTPFSIEFDDPCWRKHISSLKPLGLNVLLNTCNAETSDFYTLFTDHVYRASLSDKDAIGVVNRRCLCEMARQIGFKDCAMDIFSLDKQLAVYRNLSSPENRERYLRKVQSFIKFKTPLPNMFSVIVREKNTGMQQLLSQGTADMVLDCCSELWNGYDIVPLQPADRKRILDFYHRSSLAAYCTAFAYRPITHPLSMDTKNMIIELPGDFTENYPFLQSPSSNRSWDSDSLDGKVSFGHPRYFSEDSLLSVMAKANSMGLMDATNVFQAQRNEIFIGMVTMQYQAKTDMIDLLEKLEGACIRFVHFSEESELRSRVFSEKMGLEAGWNCHISLLSKAQSSIKSPGVVTQRSLPQMSYNVGLNLSNATRGLCTSAPDLINIDRVEEAKGESEACKSYDKATVGNVTSPRAIDGIEMEILDHDDVAEVIFESGESILVEGAELSASRLTTSSQSIPGGFYMANTAKLPKGIANIRPHIENVDNVPLLVPLFTDCTPDTTREMFKIMQEYGEVVCCAGSSLKMHNTGCFMQADISIGITPMQPEICMKRMGQCSGQEGSSCLSPIAISRTLNTISCSVSFEQEDPSTFLLLVMQARNFTSNLLNCCQFLICCELTLTLVQVFSTIFLLPPVLNGSQVLWLSCVVVPLLSVSLFGKPVEHNIMMKATGKNTKGLKKKPMLIFALLYMTKFLPSVAITLACFVLMLRAFCVKVTNSLEECHLFYGYGNFTRPGEWNGWSSDHSKALLIAQNVVAFLLTFYFGIISMSYLSRYEQLWKRLPTFNKAWCIVMPAIVTVQLLYFNFDLLVYVPTHPSINFSITDIPLSAWLLGLLWPLLLVSINELVKRREIKLEVRFQKRERLNFGTKLGMNSPF